MLAAVVSVYLTHTPVLVVGVLTKRDVVTGDFHFNVDPKRSVSQVPPPAGGM